MFFIAYKGMNGLEMKHRSQIRSIRLFAEPELLGWRTLFFVLPVAKFVPHHFMKTFLFIYLIKLNFEFNLINTFLFILFYFE